MTVPLAAAWDHAWPAVSSASSLTSTRVRGGDRMPGEGAVVPAAGELVEAPQALVGDALASSAASRRLRLSPSEGSATCSLVANRPRSVAGSAHGAEQTANTGGPGPSSTSASTSVAWAVSS